MNNFKNSHTGIGHFGHVGFKEKDYRGREQSQTRLENNNKEIVLKNGKTGKRHSVRRPASAEPGIRVSFAHPGNI